MNESSRPESADAPTAMSRLGELYEALDVEPDGDRRTVLLDELREELGRMDDASRLAS